ncbi:Uncharacterised protein [Salmonella enterica subsp. enterica serovar Typhi]|nr:Uncharacterised protein [Salmonella enterica subsp. enterica serovar Typhi]CQV70840.1 Uncharacterised protein [Salmonella enterica subsp. enterica serovar Typhi]SUG93987.1 Uncharacterised protein [Salmonella enterica subsp. enterica]
MISCARSTFDALRAEYERAGLNDRLSIFPQLHFNLKLPAKACQLGLIPQGINSWLNEIYHPVSTCVGFWQGELIRLGKVALHNDRPGMQIDIFPGQTAQLPMPHSGIDCQ